MLLRAVEIGSFSKAAEEVGYTQSGLTHLCDSVEREIGLPLIERCHSGIRLTDSGKRLEPEIRDYIRAEKSLRDKIESISGGGAETIRVAAYASIAMRWMPDILYRFRRIVPDVEVELRMVDNAVEPFDLINEGRADVVFASRQEDMDCEWTPLCRDYMYAVLPKGRTYENGKNFDLGEFEGMDFLMPYGKFDTDVLNAMGDVKPNYIQTYVDDETVIRMVGKGLGVTMMGKLMIRGNTDDVICLPVFPESFREMGMGIKKGKGISGNIEKLKECVLEYMKERTGGKP